MKALRSCPDAFAERAATDNCSAKDLRSMMSRCRVMLPMTIPFVRNSPALKASADIDGDGPADRVIEMGNVSHYGEGIFGVIAILRPRCPGRRCPPGAG